MSIVRYTNKKTGTVAVYESISHYDPVKKQSRPIRKYLGTEDPVTGKLIPSSGKPGRKKSDGAKKPRKPKKAANDYKLLYEAAQKESREKDTVIKRLEKENETLYAELTRIGAIVTKARDRRGERKSLPGEETEI